MGRTSLVVHTGAVLAVLGVVLAVLGAAFGRDPSVVVSWRYCQFVTSVVRVSSSRVAHLAGHGNDQWPEHRK